MNKRYIEPQPLTQVGPGKSKSPKKRLYTIPELVRLTGMSRRQIDYWASIGLLRPTLQDSEASLGRPTYFYSTIDALRLLIISDLRKSAFTPRKIKQVMQNMEEHGIRFDEPDSYLLTDGNSIFYANGKNEAIDIWKHHRQMLLLVPIAEQAERLKIVA